MISKLELSTYIDLLEDRVEKLEKELSDAKHKLDKIDEQISKEIYDRPSLFDGISFLTPTISGDVMAIKRYLKITTSAVAGETKIVTEKDEPVSSTKKGRK